MPFYILIPFAVFFACCLSQFWFMMKVRAALIERHPGTYLSVEKSAMFPHQGFWRFTRGNGYKALQDDELNRHVRNLKRLKIVAIISWLVCGVAMFTAPTT